MTVVVVGLGDHVDAPPPPRPLLVDGLGELGQEVHRARVVNRVDGVEAEAVDVELAHPCAPILYDMTSDSMTPLAVEVHGGTPRRLVPVAEVRPVLRKGVPLGPEGDHRSEEHTSELQSPCNLVCRLLLLKKKNKHDRYNIIAQ